MTRSNRKARRCKITTMLLVVVSFLRFDFLLLFSVSVSSANQTSCSVLQRYVLLLNSVFITRIILLRFNNDEGSQILADRRKKYSRLTYIKLHVDKEFDSCFIEYCKHFNSGFRYLRGKIKLS